MERWNENEFRRVAQTTRISTRTLDACKDVLVDGMSGTAAAEKHRMFPAHVSRALTTLRDKQADLMKFATVRKDSDEMLQYMASEVAKHLYGQDFESKLAQPGQTYEGPIVVRGKGYLVQKVGRGGILHDIAHFDHIPPLQQDLRIDYDSLGQPTKVAPLDAPEKTRSSDLGR